MTREQMTHLLNEERSAIKNHNNNINRIKNKYYDSNYGFKEGDKIRILHETGNEVIGFLKEVEVFDNGDLFITIQKQNKKDGKGRGVNYIYVTESIKIEKKLRIILKTISYGRKRNCKKISIYPQ